MFVMDCYGHKLSNGVLFAHHLILDVPGGSSHLGYRRRVPLEHNPGSRVNLLLETMSREFIGGPESPDSESPDSESPDSGSLDSE